MNLSPVVVCLFLALSGSIVVAKHKEPSRNLYRFLTLLSGYFNNNDQQSTNECTNGLDYHENMTVIWKPVVIDSLHDKITLYNEVAIAGNVDSREIWVVSEDRCGVIHVQIYLVLDCDSYKPGELEDIDFHNIRIQPRSNDSSCEVLFYSVDLNVFVGTFPGCLTPVPGVLPLFGVTVTCYSVNFHVCNLEFFQKRPILPYINFKQFSYPLTSIMTKGAHFETPCYYSNKEDSYENDSTEQ